MVKNFGSFLVDEIKDSIFGNPRADSFMALANKKGFLYKKRSKFDLLPVEISDFQVFNKMKSKKLENILQSKRHAEEIATILVFDFLGKNDWGTKKVSIVLARFENINFPRMIIQPKSTYAKIGSWFSSNDGKLDLNPQFKSRFSVHSPDLGTLNGILKSQLQEVLLAEKDLNIEAEDEFLMIFKKGVLLEPKEVIKQIQLVQRITDALYAEDERDYV